MRTILGLFVYLSALLCSSMSFTYTMEVREHIPEKYTLVVVYGADPDKPIDKEAIKKFVYAKKFSQVEKFDIAIYDKGKHFGDGMRALLWKEFYKEWFAESEPGKPLSEESELGYTVISEFFFSDFERDSISAEKIYKNTPFFLIMGVKCIARDKHGTPYIEGDRKDIGFEYTARVYLSKDDPLLSTLKLGESIIIQGKVTDFSNNIITLQGKLID